VEDGVIGMANNMGGIIGENWGLSFFHLKRCREASLEGGLAPKIKNEEMIRPEGGGNACE